MADFFAREEEKSPESEVQTIKVGEKEYSPEELNKLVGLGEIAREVETKYNTKIDRVYPEYTKTTQKVKEYEQKLAELEQRQQQVQTQAVTPQELTPEQAQLARQQLKALGFISQDELPRVVNQTYAQAKAVDQLISDADSVLKDMSSKGYPQASMEDLLKFMDEGGYKNPRVAYREMFDEKISEIEQEKLNSIKRTPQYTNLQSNAGSKSPVPQKITKQNLKSAVAAVLYGGE